MTEAQEAALGAELASVLYLKEARFDNGTSRGARYTPRRWVTAYQSKTDIGLARTIIGIIEKHNHAADQDSELSAATMRCGASAPELQEAIEILLEDGTCGDQLEDGTIRVSMRCIKRCRAALAKVTQR